MSKPIRLSAHASGYLQRRGFSAEEVEAAIQGAPWRDARLGRKECEMDFKFDRQWNGRWYPMKRVRPVFVEEKLEILVVTVYTYFF